jgi:phenylalanine ammonia-lyase
MTTNHKHVVCGDKLSIEQIVDVGSNRIDLSLTRDPYLRRKIDESSEFVYRAVADGEVVYGINTNFGGMANQVLSAGEVEALQQNLIWGLKCGAGKKLPTAHVRSAMFIRANMLAKGVSGVRAELIERYLAFLNAGVTPIVKDLGSIGASGDLVPLAQIAGCLIGLDPSFRVERDGEELDAVSALSMLGLPPIKLRAKEGLALVNGTSMMSSISSHCVHETRRLMRLALHIHAMLAQALNASIESFDPFIHRNKAHRGQIAAARAMRELLRGSKSLKPDGHRKAGESGVLLQDRYSVRCLAQYFGPMVEGLQTIKEQIEVEANSVDDNPLVDLENERLLHGGNFYAQCVALGMDQIRTYIALLAKHLDVQIAFTVAPEFNNGLPASLVGDQDSRIKFGLKGLQIAGNSIVPRLLHLGHGVSTLYPTHAEQFNQNINSQGFNSATLAWDSVSIFREYLAIALVFAVQASDLRAKSSGGTFDGRRYLSPSLLPVYEAVRSILERPASDSAPLVFKNDEQDLSEFIAKLSADLARPAGDIVSALAADSLLDGDVPNFEPTHGDLIVEELAEVS